MVSVKKKIVGSKTYYYLQHTFRVNGKVKYSEKYLGQQIPKNVDQIKAKFVFDIYKEKWYSRFEKIQSGFSIERRRMPPEIIEKAIEEFMVRFTYNTERIEGSSITFRETAFLLVDGIAPKNRPMRDIKETEEHKKVFYELLGFKKELTLNIVLEWHYKLFKETKPHIAGKLREHQVGIRGSDVKLPTPIEVPALVDEFFRWYNKEKLRLNPVELAALVHLKFVTIHPFGDGNGRISRLMMNFVLNKHLYPMLNIPYVGRASYYTALERTQLRRNDGPFIQWFFRRYMKDNKMYLVYFDEKKTSP